MVIRLCKRRQSSNTGTKTDIEVLPIAFTAVFTDIGLALPNTEKVTHESNENTCTRKSKFLLQYKRVSKHFCQVQVPKSHKYSKYACKQMLTSFFLLKYHHLNSNCYELSISKQINSSLIIKKTSTLPSLSFFFNRFLLLSMVATSDFKDM